MSSLRPELAFEVHNLGPVRQGKFTHKPLTVFCGPNNSGKTWILYSLYNFFKVLRMYAVELKGTDDTLFPELDVLNEVVTEDLPSVLNARESSMQDACFHLIPNDSLEQELEFWGIQMFS